MTPIADLAAEARPQQLRVAEGERLPEAVTDARVDGWAIEVRLYAEDVTAGVPARHRHAAPIRDPAGPRRPRRHRRGRRLRRRHPLRPDAGQGDRHGATRAHAARRLARALAHAQIHGVVTNRDLLVGILREEEFFAGRTDTGYLTRHDPAQLSAPPGGGARLAAAAALATQAQHRAGARVLPGLPSGWRTVTAAPSGSAGQALVVLILDGVAVSRR